MTKECRWPECDHSPSTRGFCKSHYDRARYIKNFEDPWVDSVKPSWHGLTECPWPGCSSAPKGRGLCAKHYYRAQQVDDYETPWKVWEGEGRAEKTRYHGRTDVCRWPGCLIVEISGHGMCSKHHGRAKRSGVFDRPWEVWGHGKCVECGAVIVSDSQQTPRICSKLCRSRHYRENNRDQFRASSEKRRAAKAGVAITDTDLQLLRETTEDCYLCGAAINFEYEVGAYDPNMPHLDHIVPLNDHGTHSLENIAYVHAQCNLMKGPRTPDQYYNRLIRVVAYMYT